MGLILKKTSIVAQYDKNTATANINSQDSGNNIISGKKTYNNHKINIFLYKLALTLSKIKTVEPPKTTLNNIGTYEVPIIIKKLFINKTNLGELSTTLKIKNNILEIDAGNIKNKINDINYQAVSNIMCSYCHQKIISAVIKLNSNNLNQLLSLLSLQNLLLDTNGELTATLQLPYKNGDFIADINLMLRNGQIY